MRERKYQDNSYHRKTINCSTILFLRSPIFIWNNFFKEAITHWTFSPNIRLRRKLEADTIMNITLACIKKVPTSSSKCKCLLLLLTIPKMLSALQNTWYSIPLLSTTENNDSTVHASSSTNNSRCYNNEMMRRWKRLWKICKSWWN